MVGTEDTQRELTSSTGGDVIAGIVQQMRLVQERRMAGYRLLQNAFKEMLTTKNESDYRLQMGQQTLEFQACSSAVRALYTKLDKTKNAAEDTKQASESLKQLQELESRRLQYTLILHALQKAGAERRFSWQSNSMTDHNHEGHGACSCAPEPTQEDFDGALREATQTLERVTNEINETLQELYDTAQE